MCVCVSRLYELCTQTYISSVQVVYSNTVYLTVVFLLSCKSVVFADERWPFWRMVRKSQHSLIPRTELGN